MDDILLTKEELEKQRELFEYEMTQVILIGAGTALTVATVTSLVVGGVAVISTLAASTLNIIDTWHDMSDNSTFKSWQKAMNWTSGISNGLYSIGSIYNSFKGISNADVRNIKHLKSGGQSFNPATAKGPLAMDKIDTFRSGTYTAKVSNSETILYRAYGGKASEIGSYWTSIKPQGSLQAGIDLALDPNWGNTASKIVSIKLPAWKTMYTGFSAPQGGLVGGGTQVFLPKVNMSWIIK
jgi:hypothetical protein